MLYLATASGPKVREAMMVGLLGQMLNPKVGNKLTDGVAFAIDAGTVKIVDGRPVNDPDWEPAKWEAYVRRYQGAPGCLFAVVPDWVCDAALTDERWAQYTPLVRSLGYRPAYVLQNGCEGIPADAEAVFVGGDDDFKLGPEARVWVAEAKRRGLYTHMGRVNTRERLRVAAMQGFDSVDGTTLAWGPDRNLPQLLGWLYPVQQTMWGVA